MRWFFQRILDRLLVKATIQVASEFEAQLTLEKGESRAALLRRAYELEQERVPGFDQLAADLRAQAAQMVGSHLPAGEVLEIVAALREDDLRDTKSARSITVAVPAPASTTTLGLPSPTPKKRGRPRKITESQAAQDYSGPAAD